MPRFTMQIIDEETGTVADSWLPGEKVEQDLASAIVNAAAKMGVGVFKTEAQVKVSINNAVHEVIYGLKASVKP